MLVSIIIPVKNEGENIISTVQSMLQAKTMFEYEIIVIDHHSTDGCCKALAPYVQEGRVQLVDAPEGYVAMPRNIGANLAKGDIFLFCDAHLFVPDFWIDTWIKPILEGIADAVTPDIADVATLNIEDHTTRTRANCGMTWNKWLRVEWLNAAYGELVPILPGGCIAITREAFELVGGFDDGFRVWGYEDQEMSLNLWLHGKVLVGNPEAVIRHLYRQTSPYAVDLRDVFYNMLRLAYVHFNPARLLRTMSIVAAYRDDYKDIMADVQANGAAERREKFLGNRVHNDDWFMKKFDIDY